MSKQFLDFFGTERFLQICNESSSFTEAYRRMNIDYRTLKAAAISLGIFDKLNQRYTDSRRKSNAKDKVFGVRTKTGWKVDPHLWCEEVFKGNVIPSHAYRLKERLIVAGYKEDKCDCCGINEWNGKPITIQCHHKDGDKRNNKLENIQFLCPNCHSQTENYLSKNRKHLERSHNSIGTPC